MTAPRAYFITFRTYGSWLPGDDRGFVDHARGQRSSRQLAPDDRLQQSTAALRRYGAVSLSGAERIAIEAAVAQACRQHGWDLLASSVRTNHVHAVIAAGDAPERVMIVLKATATRSLRASGLVDPSRRTWARHGSTRYLWTEAKVAATCNYVLFEQ